MAYLFHQQLKTAGISQNLNAYFSMYKPIYKPDYKKD
jgi:hypothetical protein